jgi:hypothetical protein
VCIADLNSIGAHEETKCQQLCMPKAQSLVTPEFEPHCGLFLGKLPRGFFLDLCKINKIAI